MTEVTFRVPVANTFSDPEFERRALFERVARFPHVHCARPQSVKAALALEKEGRLICRVGDDGVLVCAMPRDGPFGPPKLIA